jgi:ATP-dependent helicase/nuclease subunit B
VRVRFLVGPAGTGKTFRCLAEAREALFAAAEGPPLVLLAPRQGTYQLEQQLLAGKDALLGVPELRGYTRLRILSFEGLARFILQHLRAPEPRLLDEEGRLMVLRALLARKRGTLKLFRASSRLTGFAQQLSGILRELQAAQFTPAGLHQAATALRDNQDLAFKLHDLATILEEYLAWLAAHQLQDSECLLQTATRILTGYPGPLLSAASSGKGTVGQKKNARLRAPGGSPQGAPLPVERQLEIEFTNVLGKDPTTTQRRAASGDTLRLQNLWVDGFAEYSAQELELLSALLPHCEQATLTFCLGKTRGESWLSHWSTVHRTLEQCRRRFAELPDVEPTLEHLEANTHPTRFAGNPVLQHLEQHWAEPVPLANPAPEQAVRIFICNEPEGEATLAARQIARHVREGGRYRDVSVILRSLEGYHQPISRVFSRYGIPFFLDRRESIAHHPLAELTRSALRTLALGWQHEDWFAALKSGLMPLEDRDIDRLENEALAHGWRGAAWRQPLRLREQARSPDEREALARREAQLDNLRRRVMPPFEELALRFKKAGDRPTGAQLAEALLEFWQTLDVRARLEQWSLAVATASGRGAVHETIWSEMNQWLSNLELAFASDPLPLREWLPILEAGLAGLTIGVIPPALDQVLVGAVERSRTPEIKLALLLGMNETVFPARPPTTTLLTDEDRNALQNLTVQLGSSCREQLSRERYLAYIACTRPSRQLVLTCSRRDSHGAVLNPSPFIAHIRRLFPLLELETVPDTIPLEESEHACEIIGRPGWGRLVPGAAELRSDSLRSHAPDAPDSLSPDLAAELYGPALRSSVSRLEQFAACPFKFFVHSGLRAEERKTFELDVREQGTFQHDVLARFHEELQAEGKLWRNLSPADARRRVARVAQGLMAEYREGLLESTEQTRFLAGVLAESLEDFIATIVEWMHTQYRFDPVAVELPFGAEPGAPLWAVQLSNGRRVEVQGRIDRIDIFRQQQTGEALCIVVDYKSSQKQLDPVLIANGLQLQLLTYLQVLVHWPDPAARLGVSRLTPAGVFYVNLRGQYENEQNRGAALADPEQGRKLAYRHSGRFDRHVLPLLDARPDPRQGDQFNYRLNKNGEMNKNSREGLSTAEFKALLVSVETQLKQMGEQIYGGKAQVAPYRKGALTACALCEYQSICRIDPWTHRFRVLRPAER